MSTHSACIMADGSGADRGQRSDGDGGRSYGAEDGCPSQRSAISTAPNTRGSMRRPCLYGGGEEAGEGGGVLARICNLKYRFRKSPRVRGVGMDFTSRTRYVYTSSRAHKLQVSYQVWSLSLAREQAAVRGPAWPAVGTSPTRLVLGVFAPPGTWVAAGLSCEGVLRGCRCRGAYCGGSRQGFDRARGCAVATVLS
jgi:hypothetical protein